MYPFIFITIALAVGYLMRTSPGMGNILGGALALGLLLETAIATPNYLAHTNLIAELVGGGIKVVGDSSLDWGQDLKLLAEWQREHPNELLYLDYFGTADPAAYGVRALYIDQPGAWPPWPWVPKTRDLRAPGTLAISATNLQGIYAAPEVRQSYEKAFGPVPPKQILGGTIYLYDWPLPPPPTTMATP